MTLAKRPPCLPPTSSNRDDDRYVAESSTSVEDVQPTIMSGSESSAAVEVEVEDDCYEQGWLDFRNRPEKLIHAPSIKTLYDGKDPLWVESAVIARRAQDLLLASPKDLQQTTLSLEVQKLQELYRALEARVNERVASQEQNPTCSTDRGGMGSCDASHSSSEDKLPTGEPAIGKENLVPQLKLKAAPEQKPMPTVPIDKSDWTSPIHLKKIQGNPPLFSGNRQELCETLPYFRSFHGGHYVSGGRTLGYLLDGCPAPRDAFDDSGRVIISHGGGGSSRSEQAPKTLVLMKSQQRTGYRVRALFNCMQNHLPVVLLAGSNYEKMPWLKLKYEFARYAVLGYYLVTHCWPEKEYRQDKPDEAHTRFKFRFQWMAAQGHPWWLPDLEEYNSSNPPNLFDTEQIALATPVDPRIIADYQSYLAGVEKPTPQVGDNVQHLAVADSFEPVGLTRTEDHHPTSENESDGAAQDWDDISTAIMSSRETSCDFGDLNVPNCGRPQTEQEVAKESSDSQPGDKVYEGGLGCRSCRTFSLQIYEVGWMCLYELCDAFFKLDGSDITHQKNQLEYLPWFLEHQLQLEQERRVPFQLQPLSLQQIRQLSPKRRLNSDSKKGLYCIDCGRMSSRIYWGALVCSNENCAYTVNLEVDYLYTASELNATHKRMSKILQPAYFSSIQTFPLPEFEVVSYKLNDGSSYVIHAIRKDGSQFNAPASLFKKYQSCLGPQDFKRNKMRTNLVTGMVAQQFTLNAGEAYKFCTEVQTVPWEQAPYPLHEAIAQIDQFVEALNASAPDVAGGEPIPNLFNELLSCCYLPGTGMNYHADNENGVGPLVASLSLGSTALMRFKPKRVKDFGGLSSQLVVPKTPYKQQDSVLISSKTSAPIDVPTRSLNRPALELLLKHGDILLQFGVKLQADWVHSVRTKGFRIAATARHIDAKLNSGKK